MSLVAAAAGNAIGGGSMVQLDFDWGLHRLAAAVPGTSPMHCYLLSVTPNILPLNRNQVLKQPWPKSNKADSNVQATIIIN